MSITINILRAINVADKKLASDTSKNVTINRKILRLLLDEAAKHNCISSTYTHRDDTLREIDKQLKNLKK